MNLPFNERSKAEETKNFDASIADKQGTFPVITTNLLIVQGGS
jgi:hypothetical protein